MSGHVRQRSPGSWEIRYELPREHGGRRRTRTETVRGSKKLAQQRLRAILTGIDRGAAADPSKMTTGHWLEEWLAECRHTVSPKTWQERAGYVRLHMVPALGPIRLTKLKSADIQRYLTTALTSGRIDGKGGLAPQTVVHHKQVLHTALERARGLGLIAVNPVGDAKPPKVEPAEMVTLRADQQRMLLVALSGTELFVPVLLALATGLRRAEVLGAAWSAVDLDAGLLRVVQTVEETKFGVRIKPCLKTTHSRRTVVLTPGTVAVLRTHREKANGSDLLFPRWAESPAVFGTAFSRAAARIGIKCRFHDLRHTHITDLLAAGIHPRIVSERAGHNSVVFTLQRYGHVTPAMHAAAVQAIDAALPGLGSV
jgi:integrase